MFDRCLGEVLMGRLVGNHEVASRALTWTSMVWPVMVSPKSVWSSRSALSTQSYSNLVISVLSSHPVNGVSRVTNLPGNVPGVGVCRTA